MDEIIKDKLSQGLRIHHLEVINESARHRGHAGDDGSGETHYNVLVVADDFDGKPRIARQRMVNDLLESLLKQRLHALSMRCLSVSEYSAISL